MKFRVIVSDPAWGFSDSLTMSGVKRGSSSQYSVLSIKDIQNLEVEKLAAKNSVLALWCPSAILPAGLETMHAWGFDYKQTHIWVKTKKDSFKLLKTNIRKNKTLSIDDLLDSFDLNSILAFGMGRLFRQTHEVCLLGTRGKIYSKLKNKSQRSVHFYPATDHSTKPEGLQDMLDIMFPDSKRLEMFARRQRKNWICVGNALRTTFGEDIRLSIDKLKAAKYKDLFFLHNNKYSETDKCKLWQQLKS